MAASHSNSHAPALAVEPAPAPAVEPAPAAAVEPVWPARANWARSGDQLSRKPGLRRALGLRLRSGLRRPLLALPRLTRPQQSQTAEWPEFRTAERPGANLLSAPPLSSLGAGAASPDAALAMSDCGAARVSGCGAARGEPSCFRLRSGPGRTFLTAERPGVAPLGAPRSLSEVAPAVSGCGAARGEPSCFRLRRGPGRPACFTNGGGGARAARGDPFGARPSLSFGAGAAAPDAAPAVSNCGAARGDQLVSNCGAARSDPLSFSNCGAARGDPLVSNCGAARSDPLSAHPALLFGAGAAAPDAAPCSFRTAGRPGATRLLQTAQRPKGFWS
eukprot:tig00000405_g464.t1